MDPKDRVTTRVHCIYIYIYIYIYTTLDHTLHTYINSKQPASNSWNLIGVTDVKYYSRTHARLTNNNITHATGYDNSITHLPPLVLHSQ